MTRNINSFKNANTRIMNGTHSKGRRQRIERQMNAGLAGLKTYKKQLEDKYSKKWDKKVEKEKRKQAKKQAKYEKWVKDNDRRVGAYGKGMVKYSNRVNMATIAFSGAYATSVAERVGAYACKQALAKTGGVATAKTRATGAATLAAMGLTAGYTIRAISKLHKDNKLADSYADRQAAAKQVKQKR